MYKSHVLPSPRPDSDALPGDEELEENLEEQRAGGALAGEETAAAEAQVGDIAIVPFPRLREQLGCGPEAGIVVEDRRHLVKLFFPGMDRAFWLEHERVRSVPLGRLAVHPIVDRLHRLSVLLGADLIEVFDQVGDTAVFHIGFRGTDLDGLHAVRDLLGADLRRLRIEPGSMRRVKLNIAFKV